MNARFIVTKEEPWQDVISIRFGYRDDFGNLHIAEPATIRKIERDDMVPMQPTPAMLSLDMRMSGSPLQSLMDQLWQLGIRPSDIGTPGHLAATQKHLDDMRAIVAKGLEIKLP